jgi:membrane protein implicated in regulation of membrane protease activity
MFGVFLFCAVIGGTFLVCQIALALLGMGGDMDVDVPGDVGDIGDLDLDVGGDVDAGGDIDTDDSTSGFRVLSLRTIVAGLTFFGLGGLAADATEAPPLIVWGVALGCGAVAVYAVYWMFRLLYSIKDDGTVHITNAVGRHGTVYLRIPENSSGTGKVQVSVQSRTVEYLAMTDGDLLPTGTKIVVVDVLTPSTVQVEPVLEPERSDHE